MIEFFVVLGRLVEFFVALNQVDAEKITYIDGDGGVWFQIWGGFDDMSPSGEHFVLGMDRLPVNMEDVYF